MENLLLALTESQNGKSIIHFINNEEKRIIFCISNWSLIDGIFSDKWEYHTLEIDKRVNADLIFLVKDLTETYPDYSINILKIE